MLYQLLCLARPNAAAAELRKMISTIGGAVYGAGGVVTDVKSYGCQHLAYKIKGVHGKYDQAEMWQLEFAAAPPALSEVRHALAVDEGVLRYALVRRPDGAALGAAATTAHDYVAKFAARRGRRGSRRSTRAVVVPLPGGGAAVAAPSGAQQP